MTNAPEAPPEPPAETGPEPAPTATFRLPATGQLAVISVALGATPLAWAGPGLQAVYVLPVLLSWWLFWSRTVVDADGIRAYRLTRPTKIGWDELSGLRVRERHWVRAVHRDGSEVTLPAVRTRDLPLVAAASAGRVADPQA